MKSEGLGVNKIPEEKVQNERTISGQNQELYQHLKGGEGHSK